MARHRRTYPRSTSERLVLRTNDLAQLFGVHPKTFKKWLKKSKLKLTGIAITDYILITKALIDYGRLSELFPATN